MGFVFDIISATASIYFFYYVTQNLIKEAKSSDIEEKDGGSYLPKCKDRIYNKRIRDDKYKEGDDECSVASNSDEGCIKEINSIEVNLKGENVTLPINVSIPSTEIFNQEMYHNISDKLSNLKLNSESIPIELKTNEDKDTEKVQCDFFDSNCVTNIDTNEFCRKPKKSSTDGNSTCENIISDEPLQILPFISAITSNVKIAPTNDTIATEKASIDTEFENDKKNHLANIKNESIKREFFSSKDVSKKDDFNENTTSNQGSGLDKFSSNDAGLFNLSKDISCHKDAHEINAIKELDNDTISNYIYISGKKKEVEMIVDGIVNPIIDDNFRRYDYDLHNATIEINLVDTSDSGNNIEESNVILKLNECNSSDGSSIIFDDLDSNTILNDEETSNNSVKKIVKESLYTNFNLENEDLNKLEDIEELSCKNNQFLGAENNYIDIKGKYINEQPGNAHHNDPAIHNDFNSKKEMLLENPIYSGKSVITCLNITYDNPNLVSCQHEEINIPSKLPEDRDNDLCTNTTQHNFVFKTDKNFPQENQFDLESEDTLQKQLEFKLSVCDTKNLHGKIFSEKDTLTVDVNNKNIQELESFIESNETGKNKFYDNNCLPFTEKIDVKDYMKNVSEDTVNEGVKNVIDDLIIDNNLMNAENENDNTTNCFETSINSKQKELLRTFFEEIENIKEITVKEDYINVITEIKIIENVSEENIKIGINDENMIIDGQKVVRNNDVSFEQEEKELTYKIIQEKETKNVFKTIDNKETFNEKELNDKINADEVLETIKEEEMIEELETIEEEEIEEEKIEEDNIEEEKIEEEEIEEEEIEECETIEEETYDEKEKFDKKETLDEIHIDEIDIDEEDIDEEDIIEEDIDEEEVIEEKVIEEEVIEEEVIEEEVIEEEETSDEIEAIEEEETSDEKETSDELNESLDEIDIVEEEASEEKEEEETIEEKVTTNKKETYDEKETSNKKETSNEINESLDELETMEEEITFEELETCDDSITIEEKECYKEKITFDDLKVTGEIVTLEEKKMCDESKVTGEIVTLEEKMCDEKESHKKETIVTRETINEKIKTCQKTEFNQEIETTDNFSIINNLATVTNDISLSSDSFEKTDDSQDTIKILRDKELLDLNRLNYYKIEIETKEKSRHTYYFKINKNSVFQNFNKKKHTSKFYTISNVDSLNKQVQKQRLLYEDLKSYVISSNGKYLLIVDKQKNHQIYCVNDDEQKKIGLAFKKSINDHYLAFKSGDINKSIQENQLNNAAIYHAKIEMLNIYFPGLVRETSGKDLSYMPEHFKFDYFINAVDKNDKFDYNNMQLVRYNN